MGRDWIIDVLADLRNFARDNDLPLLQAQLEEATLVAQVEIVSHAMSEKRQRHTELDAMSGLSAKDGPLRRT